jgi:hypothetical protein
MKGMSHFRTLSNASFFKRAPVGQAPNPTGSLAGNFFRWSYPVCSETSHNSKPTSFHLPIRFSTSPLQAPNALGVSCCRASKLDLLKVLRLKPRYYGQLDALVGCGPTDSSATFVTQTPPCDSQIRPYFTTLSLNLPRTQATQGHPFLQFVTKLTASAIELTPFLP